MLFDLEKDGEVTVDELRDIIRAIAASRPRDPNKTPEHQMVRDLEVCNLPKPSVPSVAAFIAAHEGAALSDVAVAGQDVVTTVIRIRVPEIDRALYLFAHGTRSVIWAFEGATNKIERVILRPGDGATGVPAEKVTFVDDLNCVPRCRPNKKITNATPLVNALRREIGIVGARTHTPYEVGFFDLSSGQEQLYLPEMRIVAPPVRRHGKIRVREGEQLRDATPVEAAIILNESSYRRHYPNRLISLDPEKVVAAPPGRKI